MSIRHVNTNCTRLHRTEQNRAEQNKNRTRTEHNRAEQNRPDQSRTEQAEQSRARTEQEQNRTIFYDAQSRNVPYLQIHTNLPRAVCVDTLRSQCVCILLNTYMYDEPYNQQSGLSKEDAPVLDYTHFV